MQYVEPNVVVSRHKGSIVHLISFNGENFADYIRSECNQVDFVLVNVSCLHHMYKCEQAEKHGSSPAGHT